MTIKQQVGILRISVAKETYVAIVLYLFQKPLQNQKTGSPKLQIAHYRTPQRAVCGEFHPHLFTREVHQRSC